MSILKAIFAVFITVSASLSLDITIRGTVTDTGTTPLSGAVVKLEKYGLNATTDSHGKFTLSGAVGINPGFKQLLPYRLPAIIHMLFLSAQKFFIRLIARDTKEIAYKNALISFGQRVVSKIARNDDFPGK